MKLTDMKMTDMKLEDKRTRNVLQVPQGGEEIGVGYLDATAEHC